MATLTDIDPKVWSRVLKLREQGVKIKDIQEQTGLNYSQVWLFITDHELPEKDRIPAKQRTAETVKRLRDAGLSWGLIQVRFGYLSPSRPDGFTEGAIRSMYEEATGVKSEGLRIGRGGRFFCNERDLYDGDRKVGGVEIEKPVTRAQVLAVAKGLGSHDTRIKADGAAMRAAGKIGNVAKQTGVAKAAKKTAPAKKVTAKKAAAKKSAPAKKAAAAAADDPFAE